MCPPHRCTTHYIALIVLKKGWTPLAGGPHMHDGVLPDGSAQPLYFAEDHPTMPRWFKGMEMLICERGLWPEKGLKANCNPRCDLGGSNCCCWWLLYMQPDFITQKTQLEELIELCGHLCDFYPKYHCELNFIEQYWGAAKLCFRSAGHMKTIGEMERLVKECLDGVPLLEIRW